MCSRYFGTSLGRGLGLQISYGACARKGNHLILYGAAGVCGHSGRGDVYLVIKSEVLCYRRFQIGYIWKLASFGRFRCPCIVLACVWGAMSLRLEVSMAFRMIEVGVAKAPMSLSVGASHGFL